MRLLSWERGLDSGEEGSSRGSTSSLMQCVGSLRRGRAKLDTEALCEQLITQFGEKVVKKDVPVTAKVKKKKDAEILKVRV